MIEQQKEPYQKIIQELTDQNEEIKKQIWKNNAIIGLLKKELNQTKDNNKEIYNLKNNELVRAAGGKKVGGGKRYKYSSHVSEGLRRVSTVF